MGLKEDSVPLNETVTKDKYIKLEPNGDLHEIELELFSQGDLKKGNKYSKLSLEDEITVDNDNTYNLDDNGKNNLINNNNNNYINDNESIIRHYFNKLKRITETHQLQFGWACVICGSLCTSWIGPTFKLLGSMGVAPARRACWRSQVLLFLLLIPSFFEYKSLTVEQKANLKNKRTLLDLLICAILWFFDLFLWSSALDYTTVSRASVLSNTASLMIMAWSLIRRHPLSGMEIFGGLIGFGGIVFSVIGTNLFFASEAESKSSNPLLGDILSVVAAACVAGYVINASRARAKVTVFIYTISNTFFLFIALSIASLAFEHTTFDTSDKGIFGWVNPQFLIIVGLLSLVSGLIGFNLNNTAIKYMPPIGYSLVSLCDPFVSGTYAWIIGADGLPGIFTLLGALITISGIVTLVIGQDKRKKKEIAQNELKLREEENESMIPKNDNHQEHEESHLNVENDQENDTKVVDFVVSDGSIR